MKKSVKITADSTADLSPGLLEALDIAITDLYINIGDKTLKDGEEIEPQQVIDHFNETGQLAKTSAVSTGDYLLAFAKAKEEAEAVVHVNIGSGFSACHQNALLAAEEIGGVTVFDSGNLSTGQGQLAVVAAVLAQEGRSAEEITAILEATRDRVDASFLIDTLTYLYKGGRCSALSALGANLLKIKPCIEVRGGKMGVGKKYRGNLLKCYGQYVDDRLADLTVIDPKRVFITHSKCDAGIVDLVKGKVEALGYFENVHVTAAGCTITSHCGPNTLGVLFIRKPAQ